MIGPITNPDMPKTDKPLAFRTGLKPLDIPMVETATVLQ